MALSRCGGRIDFSQSLARSGIFCHICRVHDIVRTGMALNNWQQLSQKFGLHCCALREFYFRLAYSTGKGYCSVPHR